MSPEEIKELQRTYQARRAELYRDHPEAERFMQRKTRRLKFLLLYCFVVTLGRAVLMGMSGETGPVLLTAAVVMGFGMNAIFLAAGMGFQWKLAFLLYGWALYGLWRLFGLAIHPEMGLRALVWVFIVLVTSFDAAPMVAFLYLLTAVFYFLVLAAAMWLTLPPKNRRLAEECEALEEQWKAYIASNPVEKSQRRSL